MRRMVTRALILVGLLALSMIAGVLASAHDFTATEKGVMVALIAAAGLGGVVLQINARRRTE